MVSSKQPKLGVCGVSCARALGSVDVCLFFVHFTSNLGIWV